MLIKTSDTVTLKKLVKDLYLPPATSHKGQNGKVLVIGGSQLFHSASLWAAEVASYLVDMVHYSSTKENNAIFFELKKTFRNGMVVAKQDLLEYVKEDDAVLVGPGMIRGKKNFQFPISNFQFADILRIKNEASYTYLLTRYLITNFPNQRFIFDAGALQMMEAEWLPQLQAKAIVTPHQIEFEKLFGLEITSLSQEEKIDAVYKMAREYRCVILLKAVVDIISDGEHTYLVEGGNSGLTKGGSGDVLAGLSLALRAKNPPLLAAVVASVLLKKSSDDIFASHGYWYNITTLISQIPPTLKQIAL